MFPRARSPASACRSGLERICAETTFYHRWNLSKLCTSNGWRRGCELSIRRTQDAHERLQRSHLDSPLCGEARSDGARSDGGARVPSGCRVSAIIPMMLPLVETRMYCPRSADHRVARSASAIGTPLAAVS